jgi:hypothetical protein
MQTTSKNKNHVYDYVIVGSGLNGLAIASALNKITTNIALIESADTFGGHNRSIQTPYGLVNNGLRFLPDTPSAQKSIGFLELLMGSPVNPQSLELPPQTFELGGLKDFVGFGDNSPKFYDEISYFFNSQTLKTDLEPHEWSQILFTQFNGDFFPRSYVTRFHQENGTFTSLTVNGQKNIMGQNFIYCGAVPSLKTLLPEGVLSSKALTKLAKGKFWTAVCLDLFHSGKVTDLENIHVLNGTTQDDVGPCVGKFLPATNIEGNDCQYSQWMTCVDDQESEDSEVIAVSLKKIKRQLKRAYPDALENLKFERIMVAPSFSGTGDLKLTAQQKLPGMENFWVASSSMNPQKNLLGALSQAELIASILGCHPLGAQVESVVEEFLPSQEIEAEL